MATATPVPADEMPRLAADLGRVLETLLDETARGVAHRVSAHSLTPLQGRVLRELDRSHHGLRPGELAARIGQERPATVSAVSALRRDRLLVGRPGEGVTLTRRGRALVAELEQTRSADLRAYVDRLDVTGRRRLAAALSLLGDPH